MKILFITTYYYPDAGAAAVRLSRLAKLLHEQGHNVTVLTTLPHYPQGRIADGYRGHWQKVDNQDGVRVVQVWLWTTPDRRISRRLLSQMSFMLTGFLRGLTLPKPDVVFIEAQPIFTSVAGAVLSAVKRTPYVLNVSDVWPDYLLWTGILTEKHPIYRAARAVVNAVYRGAAGIVALSPAWARVIAGHIGQENKIRVIYNGVDLNRFHPNTDASAFRAKYAPGDAKLVTFIGTFATPYDFDTMLDVAARFVDRDDVRFLFVGDGTQADTLRTRLADGGLPNVVWTGGVIDHAAVPAAWAASHLTYLALHKNIHTDGTYPAKYYEALSAGVPVAAAAEGVAAQVLTESGGGLAVSTGDVDGLAGIIERLLDDDALRDQCSKAGRAYAETHYDPVRVADQYADTLSDAAQQSPPCLGWRWWILPVVILGFVVGRRFRRRG